MQAHLLFSLLSLAQASPIFEKRDGAAVSKSLVDVNDKLKLLTGVLNKYEGGLLAAVPVREAALNVDKAMGVALTSLSQEPTPTPDAEFKGVLDSIKTLNPEVQSAMTAVTGKAEKFGAAKQVVKSILTKLQKDEDSISAELLKRAPEAMKAQTKEEDDKLKVMFKNGVAAFS